MPVPIHVVDAFTSRPFTGNPAAVCLMDQPGSEEWMQKVAAEMKHAETAFVSPIPDGFALRWFTPATEVDLCGHATLASAHVLWETGRLNEDEPARFHTRSGLLTCTRHGYGIQMDFPAEPIQLDDHEDYSQLVGALGIPAKPILAAKNRMDYFVVLNSEAELRNLRPDMPAVEALGGRGVIVTSKSANPDYDFESRFFAPAAGIPEDPVTGSAHCCLGPYWSGVLGKPDLVGYQCSERGGTVRVAVRGERVLLQGHAVTVLRGAFVA